jgi:two-component sensor histidine kinase
MPTRAFAPYASSVPDVRRYVTDTLAHLPLDLCRTAGLLVSELATNAIRHADGLDFEVTVRQQPDTGRVWVGISDAGTGYPARRSPKVTDEHGRGLQLVSSLADRWGVRRIRGTDTKTVWFELVGPPTGPEQVLATDQPALPPA